MKRVVLALVIIIALGVLGFALSAYALDPPHDSSNGISCSTCHAAHGAPGGAITIVSGNANLCISCHVSGGLASAKPFITTDQAVPAPGLPSGVNASGTSHRWDSGAAGHVKAVGTPASTGSVQSTGTFTGRFSKTYTITTTGTGTTFSWNCRRWPTDTDGACGSGTGNTTGTVSLNEGVSASFTGSFVAGDQWRIFVRTDISHPTNAALRTSDGKIMCSSCHNQHGQGAQPFDPSAPAYGGSGTGAGRHFQRIDNGANEMCLDCHTTRNKGSLSGQTGNMTHPVGLARSVWNGLFKARGDITLPLDKGADGVAGNTDDRIQCLSCHQPHYAPTSDGSLARLTDITALCTDCHFPGFAPGDKKHLNPTSGALWPGGQYGSNFPAMNASLRGACTNCHQPHGWPDGGTPSQDYPKLLVDQRDNVCYTCHDGDPVTTTADVYTQFNGGLNFWVQSESNAWVNSRHNVSVADQTNANCGGSPSTCGQVACANCHNPHFISAASKIMDPDNPTNPFTATYARDNTYQGLSYVRDSANPTADLDPSFGGGGPVGNIGPAVAGGGNTGGDTAASGGSYTVQGDEGSQIVYTVTVSTGGNPGPPTATYSIGAATCTDVTNNPPCLDDTATSGGTYNDQGDPGNNTYTVSVATAGQTGTATLAISSTREGSLPNQTWNSGSPIPLSPRGVTITITDLDSRARDQTLVTGQRWQIVVTQVPAGQARITVTSSPSVDNSGPTPVTAFGSPVAVGSRGVTITFTDGGNGVLTQSDTWSITVSITTPAQMPDMVAFCLTCHDNTPPAGVTMSANLLNIRDAYLSTANNVDAHGRATGGSSVGNGTMKSPWNPNAGDAGVAYAALPCTYCHSGHGSDNIFHLNTQVKVNGVTMTVGSDNPGFNAANFARFGSTTYTLPCSGGNNNPDCGLNPSGAQVDHRWGAWCTFCHKMESHSGTDETVDCRSGHKHFGGAF